MAQQYYVTVLLLALSVRWGSSHRFEQINNQGALLKQLSDYNKLLVDEVEMLKQELEESKRKVEELDSPAPPSPPHSRPVPDEDEDKTDAEDVADFVEQEVSSLAELSLKEQAVVAGGSVDAEGDFETEDGEEEADDEQDEEFADSRAKKDGYYLENTDSFNWYLRKYKNGQVQSVHVQTGRAVASTSKIPLEFKGRLKNRHGNTAVGTYVSSAVKEDIRPFGLTVETGFATSKEASSNIKPGIYMVYKVASRNRHMGRVNYNQFAGTYYRDWAFPDEAVYKKSSTPL